MNQIEENFVTNFEPPIKVYVKINLNNEIIEINSDVFLSDLTGWIKVDEGYGDKYAHAQSLYLDKPIFENNNYNYKLIKNKVKEK